MAPAVMQALVAALWIHVFKVRMRKMARHASWSGLQVASQLSAADCDALGFVDMLLSALLCCRGVQRWYPRQLQRFHRPVQHWCVRSWVWSMHPATQA
jgi:hypothetical protein